MYCLQSNSGPGKALKPGKEGKADGLPEGAWDSSRPLYIDDEGIEGSGARGEVTTDLESSGSGWGPDDEDSGQHSSGVGPLPQATDILPTDDDDEDHTVFPRPRPTDLPGTSTVEDDIIVQEKPVDVDSE